MNRLKQSQWKMLKHHSAESGDDLKLYIISWNIEVILSLARSSELFLCVRQYHEQKSWAQNRSHTHKNSPSCYEFNKT